MKNKKIIKKNSKNKVKIPVVNKNKNKHKHSCNHINKCQKYVNYSRPSHHLPPSNLHSNSTSNSVVGMYNNYNTFGGFNGGYVSPVDSPFFVRYYEPTNFMGDRITSIPIDQNSFFYTVPNYQTGDVNIYNAESFPIFNINDTPIIDINKNDDKSKDKMKNVYNSYKKMKFDSNLPLFLLFLILILLVGMNI